MDDIDLIITKCTITARYLSESELFIAKSARLQFNQLNCWASVV